LPSDLYRSVTDPHRTAHAIFYSPTRSNQQQVMDWLDSTLHSPWHGTMAYTCGGNYELIGIPVSGSDSMYLRPGYWVLVYTDTKTPAISAPEDFTAYFTKDSDAMTITQAEIAEQTEYDTNLTAVYDALAILRVSPREQDFEYAAKELMDLLASAYNEGFDYGMETGQHNPYEATK
jgi:hypothetical protein